MYIVWSPRAGGGWSDKEGGYWGRRILYWGRTVGAIVKRKVRLDRLELLGWDEWNGKEDLDDKVREWVFL